MALRVRLLAILSCLVALGADASAQIKLTDWLKLPAAGFSERDAGKAIKEALTQGVSRAVRNLHATDGFFGNDLYKVLLPPDAKKADATLRRMGLGGQVDRAILAMNRGAEDAVGAAGPIFANAVRDMTVTDAIGIVRGPQDSATQYFRGRTTEQLIAAFAPSVRTSLEKTQATRYYADLANSYNRIPFAGGKVDPDLTAYVVGKAVDALFDQIAREEADIRANPAARTTDLLRKVFGASR